MEAGKKQMLNVAQALEHLLQEVSAVTESETLPLLEAGGRVLALPETAKISVPPMDNTQMDGYAVRAADCSSGSALLPLSQRIPAGCVPEPLTAGTAARIFTGAAIPPGADAVVMQEQCRFIPAEDGGLGQVQILHQVQSGEWIRRVGEDIHAGQEILATGTCLRAQDLGLAASVGIAQLQVKRKVKVALFFTGDELTMPGEALRPGAIYNSNRFFLQQLVRNLGCEVSDFGIVPDSLAATRATLRAAAQEHDVIITSGGVSVGEEDHVRPALEAEGELKMWQIAMKPGKPLAFGRVRRTPDSDKDCAWFLGLPGNPVSSFVTFLLFVRPFILKLQGRRDYSVRSLQMRADFNLAKADARNEFLRVKLNAQGGLDLFPHQGSAVLSSLVWADGLVDNPPGNVIKAGDMVRFLALDGFGLTGA